MNNTVELLGFYGGDDTHCLSAWTSTHRDITSERQARRGSMLKQLAENGHHTPFEKSYLHFLVDSEVASHIHLLKHRIGVSINAESARYKEAKEGRYYIPPDFDAAEREELERHYQSCEMLYHWLCQRLTKRIGRVRGKEAARFALPYGHMLTSDVGFNFRSFMHFQKLRNDPHAQLEIQQIADRMLELVRETGAFPLSLEAWGY